MPINGIHAWCAVCSYELCLHGGLDGSRMQMGGWVRSGGPNNSHHVCLWASWLLYSGCRSTAAASVHSNPNCSHPEV